MRRLTSATALCAVAVLLLAWPTRVVSENPPAVKPAVPPQPAPVAGRFQMTAAAGQLFLLDTSTGQVWRHEPTGKADEQFFESKIKKDADWSATLGPTYKGMPLNYWLVLLRDKHPEFQEQGMEAITHFGEQAKVALPDLLRVFLKYLPGRSEAGGVAWCIAQIDPRHEELHAMLGHKDSALRRGAALALTVLGEVDPNRHPGQAVARVRTSEAGDEGEPESEPRFKWRLPKDKDAVPVLIEMLKDREPLNEDLSYAAISLYGLVSFKTDAAAAVPEVTKLLADQDPTFRQLALKVLVGIAPAAEETRAAARTALKDTDPQVRAAGAESLGQLGDRASLPALKALMKDADPGVRQGVVQAFGCFKGDAETLVPILVEVLKTPDSQLRMPVDSPDGKQHEASNNREVNVVVAAFSALEKIGPAAKAAVPELVKQASKSEGMVFAQSARRALKKIAPDEFKKLKSTTPTTPAGSGAAGRG